VTDKPNITRKRIRIDDIRFDVYQRPLEPRDVDRMERVGYNKHLFHDPEISARDGIFYCFDGRHRVEFARRLGWKTVMCRVHHGLSMEDEALLFESSQNRRRRTHPIELFWARIYRGAETEVAILKAVEAESFSVTRLRRGGKNASTTTIGAVGALGNIYKRGGAQGIHETLRMVVRVWNGDRRATDGVFLEGVHQFIAEYGDRITDDVYAKLREQPPIDILRHAAGRSVVTGGSPTSKRFTIRDELKSVAGLKGRPRTSRRHITLVDAEKAA
jgi:hypothetical protein